MGDVVGFRDGDLWSISRLAESFGMARRTVSSRLVGVEPAGERNGNPVYHIKDASKALWQVNRAGGGTTLDLDQFPEARKAWYQSENERLKFEQNIGQPHRGIKDKLPDQVGHHIGHHQRDHKDHPIPIFPAVTHQMKD